MAGDFYRTFVVDRTDARICGGELREMRHLARRPVAEMGHHEELLAVTWLKNHVIGDQFDRLDARIILRWRRRSFRNPFRKYAILRRLHLEPLAALMWQGGGGFQ